ncbi:Glycolipid transfer protein domain [Macleaya cordata]|uniref:Glycolipid transfer protein domain n=1 Tax=Macleaya cordata TaxID=56857 RepID=A0A200R8N1_MACCD|nr:Glycolipid transfer protein domain [Macleaya cordata]
MDDLDDGGGGKTTTTKTASTPLSLIAEAFEDLSKSIKSKNFEDLRLGTFSEACSLVSVLFGCLGIAFKFAEIEYVAKVQDLVEASKTYDTLRNILDHDVENDTVRKPGSLSRNLRRVRQGLDLIRALFEQFLSSDECSLREAASSAYAEVCAPFHTWAIRTAVFAGMYALPSKQQLIVKLNETDHSVEKEMRRYIDASVPVIEYIDKLYISKNISLDCFDSEQDKSARHFLET